MFIELSDEQRRMVNHYFDDVVYPVLTPMAIDAGRPFPVIANKSLNIAVRLRRLQSDEDELYAVVQVPAILERFVELPRIGAERCFMLLEHLMVSRMAQLFPGYEVLALCPFRITRNSDLLIDEGGADLLDEIAKSVKQRRWGDPVRLEFFGDEVESIRTFAAGSQRSLEKKDSVVLLGIAEEEDLPPQPPSLKGGGSQSGSPLPSARGAGGVGRPSRGHLIDYLPAESWVVLVEPRELKEQAKHFHERVATTDGLFTPEQAFARLMHLPSVVLSALPPSQRPFTPFPGVDLHDVYRFLDRQRPGRS